MKVEFRTQLGEAFAGSGPDAAHVNTVLGVKGGPVETAWVSALATPTHGHERFVAVLRPNLPVKPMTLFVPKAAVREGPHQQLTWGAAQAGVAGGVADAVAEGVVEQRMVEDLLLVAAIWVDWAAGDAAAVYANNREATARSLRAGARGTPSVAEVLASRARPSNPFFDPDTVVPGEGPGQTVRE